MSLRSEYSYSYVFNPKTNEYDVTVYHQPPRIEVSSASIRHRDDVDDLANHLISTHMEKVTRMLEGGTPPENGEATDMTTLADHLASKADHDNQVEKDLKE